MTTSNSLGTLLCNLTIFIGVLVYGDDAFGASVIPMKKYWMISKIIEP
jgi:hypothetical protein